MTPTPRPRPPLRALIGRAARSCALLLLRAADRVSPSVPPTARNRAVAATHPSALRIAPGRAIIGGREYPNVLPFDRKAEAEEFWRRVDAGTITPHRPRGA